jgi:hypothetical protein
MKDLIHRINPPGLIKPHRGSVFSAIGTVFDKVKTDAEKAFFAHFPYMANMPKLVQHGKSLSIPRFVHDSDEEYRKRVAAAAFYLTNMGGRAYTITQLQDHFGDRYMMVEQFLQLQVKVVDFTDEDKLWLRNFLDSTLDPNISFALTEWFNFVDAVTLGDIPLITAVRKDRDVYPRGLRYDGRIKYDHGREIHFDGSGTYNGAWNYCNVVGQVGTVSEFVKIPEVFNGTRTYGGEISYSGDTEIWAPEDIQNPATYGSGKDDDTLKIQMNHVLEDHAELYPTFDGRLSCGGAITYGGTQPDMVDDSRIEITQRVSLADTVEITDETSVIEIDKQDQDIYPSGLRYDGRIKYDHGIAPCFDGNIRYNGDVRYDQVIAKPGTVIDSIQGDIAASAKYNSTSGEQDTLETAVTLQSFEDHVAVQPTYNGLLSYKGAVKYGSELPLARDDMWIQINRRFGYNGQYQYDGAIYAGIREEVI